MFASATIVKARDELVVCSLNSLLLEYEYRAYDLKGLDHVLQCLENFDVKIDPEFRADGDLDIMRTLKKRRANATLEARIDEMLAAGGENFGVELKSSISIDTKRKAFQPGQEISVYVKEELKQKLAQEICAFLNRSGGVIYLGIANDLAVLGCEDDFEAHKGDGTPEDKADLIIRSIIEKYFVKPSFVCSHLQVQCIKYQGKYVVLIEITRMRKLAFLKKEAASSSELYIRVGTSAQPIPYCEIEDYFTLGRIVE